MNLQGTLPQPAQQIVSQLAYQLTEDLNRQLDAAREENQRLRQQLEQDREYAEIYRNTIKPLQLLNSAKNEVTIKYRSLSEQEMLDRLRTRVYTFQPRILPNAYRRFLRSRTTFGVGMARDPAAMVLEKLLEILDTHPELLAEIVTTPRYQAHFVDISFTESQVPDILEDCTNV